MSQSAVVQAIANCGPISRASVAKITGRSKQTVSEIVSNLESTGWVRAVGQTEGHIGRRAIVYEISPTVALVASVDLGGSKVRVALCDLNGNVMTELVEPTAPLGGKAVIDQIARMVRTIVSKSGNSFDNLNIVVVGVPGVPDPESGAINMAPNIAGIDRLDLAGSLKRQLQVDVIVENDVNLAARGEHWLGNHGEQDSLVYLSVGTGIGAGIVVGGSLLRGINGAAGEVGFLPFGADPFDPDTLDAGALERATATNAIIRDYLFRTGDRKTVPEVFNAAESGDADAIDTLDTVARQIARATVAIVAVIDPSTVVIGGSIGSRDELLERIVHHASCCFPRKIKIEKTRLGAQAALAGGAVTALQHLHVSLFAAGQNMTKFSVPPAAIENFITGAA